jgi:hypothetical protein
MTYRSDSEGYGPYGKIIPAKINKEENYTAIFSMKTKDYMPFYLPNLAVHTTTL